MTDKPADKPSAISETIPSQAGMVSGIGSLCAPFIYTDWVASHGCSGGVASFTLEAIRLMDVGDHLIKDRVVVAHLRMPLHTMRALKGAIQQVELMLKPPASEEKN